MFMKKTILLLWLMVAFFSGVSAQEEQENLKWYGFRSNGFWSNWEVSVGVGPAWYTRYGDSENPSFSDLTKMSVSASAGKWFSPIVGARVQLDFARGAGILLDYPAGTNTMGLEAGDQISFNYMFLHYDQMISLTNWILGYKLDRLYNGVLALGFGWAHNFTYHNNNEFAFNFGLQNRFRLSDNLNINAELNCMLTKADFHFMADGPLFGEHRFATGFMLTVGATYKFPVSTWDPSPICPDLDPYNDRIASLESDLDNAMKSLDEANKQIAQNQEVQDKCAKELETALAKLKDCEARPVGPTQGVIENTDVAITIFFDKGDILTPDAQNTINQVANVIKKNDKNTTYMIVGYADKSTGSYQGNMNISKKRAERVRAALIKQGVRGAQLKVDWKGDTEQPYSEESGILNRVVIISLMK